jgi:hypothetical protein
MTVQEFKWQTWLKNADDYLKAIAPNKISRFGTDIRYNLITMALENYIMAILDYHNNTPGNHSIINLMRTLESIMPIDKTLKQRILKYTIVQSICSIDLYNRKNPTEEDIEDLTGAVNEIGNMAHKTCKIDV